MSSIYLYFLRYYQSLSKRQKLTVFRCEMWHSGLGICQILGQELGTLVPRPQNPWAVRGEQFLTLPSGRRRSALKAHNSGSWG